MYKKINDFLVKRLTDNAIIPFDLSNNDFQQYLAWIADGNTPEPADKNESIEIPQVVTMRQARLALHKAKLLDDIETIIASIPDSSKRKALEIEWEYGAIFERNSELVKYIAQSMKLSEKQLDDLFTTASTL